MSVLQAILLGIVQGITEFLPVSSFGHLAAIENAMGITRNTAVLFEVLLHVGTLAAIFFAFHEDIRRIGEELLGMVMDVIGNLNIYFHNRRTGEQLGYARLVSGTYRKLTGIIYSHSHDWLHLQKTGDQGGHFHASSGHLHSDHRNFSSCDRSEQHRRN